LLQEDGFSMVTWRKYISTKHEVHIL